jgi:hypothetical protein
MLAAVALCGERAHAQARGPSAMEVLANGQDVGSSQAMTTWRVQGWRDIPIGEQAPDPEFAALGPAGALDPQARAAQLRQLDAWLRKLAGRYRIEGTAETPGVVTPSIPNAAGVMVAQQPIPTILKGKVLGLVDCDTIGEGPGLHCVMNATWDVIDIDITDLGGRPTISEQMKTFTPAMLDIGLNRDPPGIRALLVTDDTVSHMWAGKLDSNTLVADRLNDCKVPTLDYVGSELPDYRCLQPLEITPGPGDAATIILRTVKPETPPWVLLDVIDTRPRLTLTLTLRRDDEVTAESLRKEAEDAKKAKNPRLRKRR